MNNVDEDNMHNDKLYAKIQDLSNLCNSLSNTPHVQAILKDLHEQNEALFEAVKLLTSVVKSQDQRIKDLERQTCHIWR